MFKFLEYFQLVRDILSLLDKNKDLLVQIKELAASIYELVEPYFRSNEIDGRLVMSAPAPEVMQAAAASHPEPVQRLISKLQSNPEASRPLLEFLKKVKKNPGDYVWIAQLLLLFL